MNRLVIIGAGGHGKVLADNAQKNGYTDICFVDDYSSGECMGFPIIGSCQDLTRLNDGKTDFIIGIGDNETRKAIAEAFDVNWVSLIYPTASIGMNVSIGKGTVVMAGAVVNTCATVGEHCIINTGAIVEHDNMVGDFVHLSPKVALGGTVCIGDETHVGIGATISNNITICAHCIIGAGSVIIDNITESGTYVGVHSRKIK